MWISKKKFNQMMAEEVEKERDKEMLYRFMEEVHTRLYKLEHMVEQNTEDIQYNRHYTPTPPKKQLNG